MTRHSLSEWHRQVLTELAVLAEACPNDLKVVGARKWEKNGAIRLRLRITTADVPRVKGGLPIGEREEFLVFVGPSPLAPPQVEVDHTRFLRHPHVLQGQRLCLYLDPSREWDPLGGSAGFLDRLNNWLSDAAAGRFDAQTALYHAVGGVLHITDGAPTIVVRRAPAPLVRAQHGWLVTRTPSRLDLSLARPADVDSDHAPIVRLDTDLPFGAGTNLVSFLHLVDNPSLGHEVQALGRPQGPPTSAVILTVLGASAIRKLEGTAERFIVSVPHPTGGPPHLLAATIPASGADHIRDLVRRNRGRSAMVEISPAQLASDTPLEWSPISDERRTVTIRRDAERPVAAFAGATVHVWGCGGIGAWMAEFITRAGAEQVVLCDFGRVSGGVLVRQNYVEDDVGDLKVEGLARRLRAISDNVEVVVHDALVPTTDDVFNADLIIDATVSVAMSRLLDGLADTASSRPVLAQVATDTRTGTLGILTVSMPPHRAGPGTIDQQVGDRIRRDGKNEAFHCLWRDADAGDEIIPTRGCSMPTFHGSAADLAGVAASLTSLLGVHLSSDRAVSGTHLVSLPHGEAGPLKTFLAVDS